MFYNSAGYISHVKYISDMEKSGYPYSLPVLRNLNLLELDSKVTFLVGENGSGKSTLIEAIALAYGFNSEGGSRNFDFSTNDSVSSLYKNIYLQRTARMAQDGYFLRAESFYNVASQIDSLDAIPAAAPRLIEAYGGVSLHQQSHGEAFLSLFNNRFRGYGFYVLDEPEAALSAERQLSFLFRLHELVNMQSQFIIATHSPILLSYPEATIYNVSDGGLEKVSYEETKQYTFMKYFINNYKNYIEKLLY